MSLAPNRGKPRRNSNAGGANQHHGSSSAPSPAQLAAVAAFGCTLKEAAFFDLPDPFNGGQQVAGYMLRSQTDSRAGSLFITTVGGEPVLVPSLV